MYTYLHSLACAWEQGGSQKAAKATGAEEESLGAEKAQVISVEGEAPVG